MAGVEMVIYLHQIAIVIMAVVVVVVDVVEACRGVQIIVVSSSVPPSTEYCVSFIICLSTDHFYIYHSVMVSGLPSSASWQDLKVRWNSKMVPCCTDNDKQ